jgi:HSP20 family molecular chaperone IbpA
MNDTQPIDNAIDQVERLFRSVTGRDTPPVGDHPYSTIPPEKNPEEHVQEQIDLLVEKLSELSGSPGVGSQWTPPVSFWEGKSEMLVTLDVPGVPREAIQVMVNRGVLEITGTRQVRAPEEERQFALKYLEHPFGKFRRTLPLPPGAHTEGLEARVKDGVLEIRIPRDPGITDAKTIHIT